LNGDCYCKNLAIVDGFQRVSTESIYVFLIMHLFHLKLTILPFMLQRKKNASMQYSKEGFLLYQGSDHIVAPLEKHWVYKHLHALYCM
jgi:hypothetical protein